MDVCGWAVGNFMGRDERRRRRRWDWYGEGSWGIL
jgi:hypothetical protein